MLKKSRPTAATFLSLLTIVAIAACTPDKMPGKGDANGKSAKGTVSVTDDGEAPLLQWTPPPVTLDLNDAPAALRIAKASLGRDDIFANGDSALPIVLQLLASPALPEASRREAESLRSRAVRRLLEMGGARLPILEESPAALAEADMIAAVIRAAAPGDAQTYGYLDRLEVARQVAHLNGEAQQLVERDELGFSPDQGAQKRYREVLALDSVNATAQQGLQNIENLMLIRSWQNAESHWYNLANQWLDRAAQVRPQEQQAVVEARARVALHRAQYLDSLKTASIVNLPKLGGLRAARSNLVEMIRVAKPGDPAVSELRTRIDLFEHYGEFQPGQTFTDSLPDGSRGPVMVVIPHGAFVMGSTDADPEAQKIEKPAHDIRFARGFALAQHEVTVAEFGRFMLATKHRTRASRRGFSTVYSEKSGNFTHRSHVDWHSDFHGAKAAMDSPVMHVSARDAQAYVEWLSERTGKKYRLPSEAEFEYANRATGVAVYPWGPASPPRRSENLTGLLDVSVSSRRWSNGFAGYGDGHWGPAPAMSFLANRFGLYDLGGNLSEWTADCIHASFRRAPADGKAWINSGCRSYVTKGGSWASSPAQSRSAFRMGIDADTTSAKIGFRIARDI